MSRKVSRLVLPEKSRTETGVVRALSAVVAVIAVGLGVWLVLHPLASVRFAVTLLGVALIVAGALEFLSRRHRSKLPRAWGMVLGAVLVVFGALILLVPAAMGQLPLFVALVLLISGTEDLVRGIRSSTGYLAHFLSAGANLIFGVLVIAWPDISMLLVALIFGLWMIIAGLRVLVRLARGRRAVLRRAEAKSKNLAVAILSFVLALGATAFGGTLTGPPAPDEFYATPADVPDEPGQLLRAEPFTRAMPDGSVAWRILFTTKLRDGSPAVSSGLAILPEGGAADATVAWAHGTTGVATGCAPSLQADPLASGAMPDIDRVIEHGWGIVASDYVGLGAAGEHAYLVGEEAAHSVLDAVRASRQLEGAVFGEDVVVWGHSQGGGVSLWTGGAAPEYAPEINVRGIAAMAPAADLPGMMRALEGQQAETLVGPLVLFGMSAAYPDVQVADYIKPEATPIYEEVVARCWTSKDFLVNVLDVALNQQSIWAQSPLDGALGARVAENVPTERITTPLLVAQGGADTLVLPEVQQEYVASLCQAGQELDFRVYDGKNHLSVVQDGSPLLDDLMTWTEERLAGKLAQNTC